MEEEEKEKVLDVINDGQEWMDSNPEADAKEAVGRLIGEVWGDACPPRK